MATYRCPKCGDADSIDVQITTWARLVQDDDNFETDTDEAVQRDHEWDEFDPMICRACNYFGKAWEFAKAGEAYKENDDGE